MNLSRLGALALLLLTPRLALADDAWEIYAYWSVDELYIVFNGISSILKSAGFVSLTKTTMIFSFMIVLFMMAFSKDFVMGLHWTIKVFMFFMLLNVPQPVIIKDVTGVEPPKSVANVPAILAASTSLITHASDFFTRSFEVTYQMLPGIDGADRWKSLTFREHDFAFGHRLVKSSRQMRIADPDLQADMVYFTRDCINAGFAEGALDFKTVFQGTSPTDATNGTWAYITKNVNPARITSYHDAAGNLKIGYCDDVANGTGSVATDGDQGLTQRLDAGVKKAIEYYGQRFNKNDVSGAIFASNLANAYGVMLNASMSASDIIKQNMFLNLYQDSKGAIGQMLGDSAAVMRAYADAQATATMNSSLIASGNVAMKTMPRLYSNILAMLLMVFPLVVVLAILPSDEGPNVQGRERMLGVYLKSLIFLGLFPPLYAVSSFFSTMYSARELKSIAALSNGLSIQTMDMVGNAVISDLAMQGWITTVAVPAIAGLLAFRGGAAAMGMMSGWMGQIQQSTKHAGAGAAMGNINQGNLGMDNASANKVDMSGSYAEPTRYQHTSGAGWTNTFTSGGGHILDGGKTVDNLGAFSFKGGTRLAASAQRQSEEAESAAIGNMRSYAETTAAALQQHSAFERGHGVGARSGVHSGVGQGSSRGQEASSALELAGQFAKEHNLTQTQAAEVMLQARASASLGGKIPGTDTGASVGATAELTGRSTANAAELLKAAKQFNEKTGFGAKVDSAIRASQEDTFDTSRDSSARGSAAIRGGYDQGRQALDQASANYQRAQGFKRALSKIGEDSVGIDRNLNQQFKVWLAGQDDGNGQKLGLGGAVSMIVSGSTKVDAYADRFLKEVEGRELQRLGIADPGDGKGVRQAHQENATGIKGPNAVAAHGADWQARARAEASRAGVDPRQAVTSAVPAQAAARIEADKKEVAQGGAKVTAQGQPIKQDAGARTQPGSQNLAGLAATNGVAQVTPDGFSKGLMGKLPGVNASVGTPGAAVAEASAERAKGKK